MGELRYLRVRLVEEVSIDTTTKPELVRRVQSLRHLALICLDFGADVVEVLSVARTKLILFVIGEESLLLLLAVEHLHEIVSIKDLFVVYRSRR